MKWFCRFSSGLEGNSSWDTRLWALKKDHSTFCFLLIIVWSSFVLLLWVGPFFPSHFGVNFLTSSSLYSFGSRVSADRDPECIPYDQQLTIRTGAGGASHVTMPFSEAPDITHASLRWEDKLNLRSRWTLHLKKITLFNFLLSTYIYKHYFEAVFIINFFYLALGQRFHIAVSMHLKTRTFDIFAGTFEVFLNCFYFYSIFSKLILPSFLLLSLMRVFSFRERLIYSHVFNPMLVRRSSKKVIRDYCVPKSKYYTYNSKVFFIQYLIYWYL